MKYMKLLLIVLLFACNANTNSNITTNAGDVQPYQIGEVVNDFKLINVDDNYVSLAQYEDAKGFIVIFTCNHCPFSVLYEDRIIELDKMSKEKGYPVIAINPNDIVAYPEDGPEPMKVRAKEKGFTFPYLYDETQEVAVAFGALKTPHVFLLNKEDKGLVLKYTGAIDDSTQGDDIEEKYVSMAIDAIQNGKEVKPNATKAIGCSVKWKK